MNRELTFEEWKNQMNKKISECLKKDNESINVTKESINSCWKGREQWIKEHKLKGRDLKNEV